MKSNSREYPILPEKLSAFASLLLRWYDQNARVLPWREQPTPYRVWVSEIMLQQTRVETAIPYFERFVATLKDIQALADASEDVLLKLWEGLGYYNRVRNMQKAAAVIVAKHNGILPSSFELLKELPGIGEYTAGAIASIAYNIPAPAVDGNVLRVLSRLLASFDDVSLPQVKQKLQSLAYDLIPQNRAGDFNQAMMELGAMVCLPNATPHCADCPVSELCEGYRQGCAQQLPVKPALKERKTELRTILVILSQNRILLKKRPAKGLLSGMWELPGFEEELTQDGIEKWLKEIGAEVTEITVLGKAKHIFSHIEWRMQGYLARTSDFTPSAGYEWANKDELREKYALPSAFRMYERKIPW